MMERMSSAVKDLLSSFFSSSFAGAGTVTMRGWEEDSFFCESSSSLTIFRMSSAFSDFSPVIFSWISDKGTELRLSPTPALCAGE